LAAPSQQFTVAFLKTTVAQLRLPLSPSSGHAPSTSMSSITTSVITLTEARLSSRPSTPRTNLQTCSPSTKPVPHETLYQHHFKVMGWGGKSSIGRECEEIKAEDSEDYANALMNPSPKTKHRQAQAEKRQDQAPGTPKPKANQQGTCWAHAQRMPAHAKRMPAHSKRMLADSSCMPTSCNLHPDHG
jgi:hypothetical protein